MKFMFYLLFMMPNLFAMSSESYRLFLIEDVNVSNMASSFFKTSFSYSMSGNTGNFSVIDMISANYSANPGLLNSWRPPKINVDTAHTYPNPCNIKKGCNGITITNLTISCEIRIFNISGENVAIINKNSNLDSTSWDLKNKNGKYVSSGLYIFWVKGNDGSTKTGKILIIR